MDYAKYPRCTYFLISRSFCQCGNSLFKSSNARQIIGSPKKPNPTKKVVIFVNRYEVVKRETSSPGRTRPASLSLGVRLGKGEVGDKALGSCQELVFLR